MTTLIGSRTAKRRGAVRLRTSRIACSSCADLDDAVRLRHADRRRELADPLGRVAAPAHAGDGRHPRVVPALDVAVRDELAQDALRHHGVGQVEPRELVLVRARRHRQVLDEPVVERPVDLEFERADRVGHALDRVRLAVREVVGRVDAPRVAGARMLGVDDPVEHRVAQVDVRRSHVDAGAQDAGAVRELAAHASARTGRGSRRPVGRATGCRGRVPSACRDAPGSRRPTGRRRRPCRPG